MEPISIRDLIPADKPKYERWQSYEINEIKPGEYFSKTISWGTYNPKYLVIITTLTTGHLCPCPSITKLSVKLSGLNILPRNLEFVSKYCPFPELGLFIDLSAKNDDHPKTIQIDGANALTNDVVNYTCYIFHENGNPDIYKR